MADRPTPPEDITPDDFYLKWIPEQAAANPDQWGHGLRHEARFDHGRLIHQKDFHTVGWRKGPSCKALFFSRPRSRGENILWKI